MSKGASRSDTLKIKQAQTVLAFLRTLEKALPDGDHTIFIGKGSPLHQDPILRPDVEDPIDIFPVQKVVLRKQDLFFIRSKKIERAVEEGCQLRAFQKVRSLLIPDKGILDQVRNGDIANAGKRVVDPDPAGNGTDVFFNLLVTDNHKAVSPMEVRIAPDPMHQNRESPFAEALDRIAALF